ncbi:MAG TPA: PepSY-like domain-containing protein [Ignavibacteria bacterium]|jgi:hypothetical protein
MKKLIVILFICAFGLSINAQNLKESDIPSPVKEKFSSMYPHVTDAKWEMENGKYEAEFKQNNVETSVLFEANGTYFQTEVEIPVSSLPAGVSDYVSKNLRDSKITEASKIFSSKGIVTYEAEIGRTDYLFDATGNFLSKESDTNETDDDK